MFLKLSGVQSFSKAARHKGEIEILGWSWGTNQRVKMSGQGVPQGELTTYQNADLNITKTSDGVSQTLQEACLAGKQFSEAVVTTENVTSNGSLRFALIMTLTNVTVESFGTVDATTDFAAFRFEKVEIRQFNGEK